MNLPTMPTARYLSAVATAAVSALTLFSPPDRATAATLITMWSDNDRLSPADREAVLDAFGPVPEVPAHVFGFAVGGRS